MRKSIVFSICSIGLFAVGGGDVPAAEMADVAVSKLEVGPSPLLFTEMDRGRRILVTGFRKDGSTVDLTSSARIESVGDTVSIGDDGLIYPAKKGRAQVLVEAGGRTTRIDVDVSPIERPTGMTFVRDVLPVINKIGCTAGTCHGSAKGKNGFKLSLRGYDPEFDYQSLIYDMSGRRFNRADPAQSLMLAKPTQQVAHGGGYLIPIGSHYYETLFSWISAGVPFGDADADKVDRLAVMPESITMQGPGKQQPVIVVAHYKDGSVRDVTAEAHLTSSNTETVNVKKGAEVQGDRVGESTLLVRYEGKFATAGVTVLDPKPGFSWPERAQYNFIDEHVDAKLRRLKIQPSDLAGDAEFLRRLSLDLTGQLPKPEEIRAFLSDSGGHQKRARIIDELVRSDAYVDYWTLKWSDLLRSNRKFMKDKGMWSFRRWLRQAIAENRPYDQFVRELLTSRGSTYQNPAAGFFSVTREPKEAMQTTTQLFMGVRMVCAQCHDHPFERWTQNQYYEMTDFFAGVSVRPGFQSGEEVVFIKRDDEGTKHPKNGAVVNARYLVETADAPMVPVRGDRRAALAEWLTSPENPYFARAIVNRIWSYFTGRGIIDPVDDIRASNPAVNQPLLDALARDFVAHDYDLRHLIKRIVSSRVYQASFRTNEWNANDGTNFSHYSPRRLTAEQLADALAQATGSHFEFPTVPEDFNAVQLPDPHVDMDGFLELFGRPQREQPCECERKSEMSLPQIMNLINGPTVANAIADPEGRVSRLLLQRVPNRELVDELYLATLSRLPTPSEYRLAKEQLGKSKSRAAAAQDLMWALLNSKPFLFNR